ncbi:MAG TPA: glycosyltransferase family 39 protein, partial [bacterium]
MVTHGFLLATPFIDRTFDAEAHLFFASHYYQGWFDPWEPRWYGGFFVFSYPPLVHQLVALLGHIVDLESSYKLIQAIVAIAVPASIFVLARELVDETVGAYAAFAAVILSGTYLLLYSFGQLANVAAVPLIVTATTFFSLHLREGRPVDLLASAGFGSAAVLTTTTSVLILPALLSAVFLQRAFQDWSAWRHLLRRALCATLATLAVTIAASSPFWWWLISEAKPIAPIPHFTRTNIFSNATSSELLFWNMYGGELLILPFIVLRGALFQRSISVLSA